MKVNHQSEKGIVLIMTLVILLIVTMLGVSSVQLTGLLEKMARNGTDTKAAFHAAEAALLDAEKMLAVETGLTDYQANANGKYLVEAAGVIPRWEDNATWTGSNSIAVTYSDGAAQPLYIIEFVKTVLSEEDRLNLDNVGGGTGADRTQIFRVTALGTGKTSTTKLILQSTYGKKF